MKKVSNFIKKNFMLVFGFVIGILLAGTGVYATTVASSSVSYNNSSSKLSSSNVQGAIDALYDDYKTPNIANVSNIVSGYTYNSSTCVTGDESTCVKTTCYKTKISGSCPAGTIIDYKVNDNTIVRFHVMYDSGSTMTMQSQKNTVYSTAWYASSASNTSGPTTILPALESVTAGWSNVNNQTYTMGTTSFKTNAYTGCSSYSSCTTNTYTLASRTAKARMITVQEAAALGCTTKSKSCPNWMNNYLYDSTSYGGTVNDNITLNGAYGNYGYWTMSAESSSSYYAWYVFYTGYVSYYNGTFSTASTSFGARAVVVVSK
jgi:hypothetical protein